MKYNHGIRFICLEYTHILIEVNLRLSNDAIESMSMKPLKKDIPPRSNGTNFLNCC